MRRSGVKRGFLGVLGLVAATAAGCSGSSGTVGPTYAVTGRVVLADGKPLTAGRVTLIAADGLKPPASGEIGADGRFALTTKDPKDGAVPGDYKVRIEPAAAAAKPQGRARGPKFPLTYVDEDSSGLTVTVKPSENDLGSIRLR
ncbi:MAG: hypothetical protein U0835_27210 [Isosphaeraceae bacterium]